MRTAKPPERFPGSTIDGRADTVFHTPAVVRDHDGIDTRIGGELGVLEGKNALEHELDLDRIAQALDQVPGQVGDNRAAGRRRDRFR